jgi:hypothetical protein
MGGITNESLNLRDFNWDKNELSILIRATVISMLVNQNAGKFDFKMQ